MTLRDIVTSLLLTQLALALGAMAAEPTVEPKDLPRVPPTEPDKALGTFKIRKGFRIELVAAEPLVVDPVAMAFDENGRLFVVEMRDYSERRDERLGRIRLVEDTDGDGRFDKSTIFADNLPWPTAVTCWNGGIFVGASPDLIWFKDTDGDGVADERKVVFTGFGSGVARLNVQALLNSFTWGFDNRIHGATAANGGSITSVNKPTAKPLELRGRDFSFDPRTLEIRAENGGAQYGLCFDNHGRKFVCSNSSHIQTVMYEERYAARNPFYALPRALVDIAVDGPAAEVYRISPDEPWRVIRTQWRVAGQVSGPIEGGGRASGYFTAATGITIYRGNAFPEEFAGDAFVADCGSNLVHRKKVRPDGVGVSAERPVDEQKVEFLASTDNWFRPVQLANGPDGCLYIVDMYREVIEHPWSLPESLKQHLDLNSGNDRGRIYRIVPEGFKQPKPPRLGKATIAELVATLGNPNGWQRDTAARLLCERQNKAAVPLLEKLLAKARSPLARLHALCALDGLDALSEELAMTAFADPDPSVREHAVLLCEKMFPVDTKLSGEFWNQFRKLTDDPNPRVRYQLAFTLGQIRHDHKPGQLAALIRRDADDPWMQAAVLNSADGDAATLFSALWNDGQILRRGETVNLLKQLAQIIGAQHQPPGVEAVLRTIVTGDESAHEFATLSGLAEGLQRSGGSLRHAASPETLKTIFHRAGRVVADTQQAERLRVQAVQLVGWSDYATARTSLLPLLAAASSQAIQLAALSALDRFTEPELGDELTRRWGALTPRLRSEVLSLLLKRPERIGALLTAIENKLILPAELSSTQINFLRTYRDPASRERATKLLGDSAKSSRPAIVEGFLPALQLTGNAKRGQTIYLERCSSCHRLAGQGSALGPDLVTVRSGGKEKILVNILDPNREVAPNFLNYLVETRDGESVLGIIGNETAASVTLKQANGVEVVLLRSNIARLQSQGLSAMPEGLEAGLSPQDMADLLEYVMTAGDAK